MEKTLESLVSEIYSDSRVSPVEIIQLRKFAEKSITDLLEVDGNEGMTNALCKSFEVTNQLLQATFLKAKKEKASPEFKAALVNAINAQIELLKANSAVFGK